VTCYAAWRARPVAKTPIPARRFRTAVYGAAGSIVIVLLWVYYSSQVVLLGAVTRVYAKHRGGPLEAKEMVSHET
jgi:uncharacterized BrkB/YihY/UPF0761 family membrane protein